MSHRELFASQSNVFGGVQKSFEEADYVILGVPFDVTSTYRTGARFGPTAIRQASLNIETYSFRSELDVEKLKLHDLGDLHVSTDTEKTLQRLKLVVEEIIQSGKTPVTIGGEHTITLGIAESLRNRVSKTALVSFDAHLDLRDEFLGLSVSHTTYMRRVNERVKPAKIVEAGTRAVCQDELSYAEKSGIEFFTSQRIKTEGSREVAGQIKQKLAGYEHIYVSVDMDVLDPAYAPAVQNPEADGIDTNDLLNMLSGTCDGRLVGFDVVEIAPDYDQGISAVTAAKVIFELLCLAEKSRKENRL